MGMLTLRIFIVEMFRVRPVHTTPLVSSRILPDSGSLRMLQWAMDHALHPTEDACKAAALNGHMKALRFLRSHDCPWGGRTLKKCRI